MIKTVILDIMGCNCKKKAERVSKYTDDKTIEKLKGVKKIRFKLRYLITLLLVIIVFIIMVPFGIIYGIVHILKGEKIKINISKIIKIFNVKVE
jgi:hypothetical protein